MSDQTPPASEPAQPQADAPSSGAGGRIPIMQRILDNPFLLLFLGVAMPTVFYLMWGVMEIAQIPIAPR